MKKVLSLILAFTFVFLSFSGCSSSDKTEEEKPVEYSLKNTFDSIYSDFDDSVIHAYEEVCGAIVKGNEDVRINLSMLEDVQQLLYTSYPLIYLVDSITPKTDKSGISLKYKNEAEEHSKLVSQFNAKINQIEKECGFDTASNSLYTLNVYHYVASHIKITEKPSISLFETVMNDEGTVFTYSNLFEYLLLQKGIKAFHIIACDARGTGWGLSSAELNGEIYYFDVGSEYYSTQGNNINYFALNYSDLQNEGLNSIKYTSQGKAFKSKADGFKACRSCKEWSVDGQKLKILQYDLKKITIELK